MPRLQSRKEGRGNGSKTGILNISEVAKKLKRNPEYITKFIGYELGAQSKYTNKENEGERVVITGHHEQSTFQQLVDKFIHAYVLCHGCSLPEIDMVVKGKSITATCKACGWKGELDNKHKLATFIVKNPPTDGVGFDGEGAGKKSREEKQKEREKKKKKDDDDDDEESHEEKAKKEKKEKKDKKDKKEKKSKKEKKEKDDDDDSDDEAKEKKKKKDKKEKKDKKDKKDKKEKKEKKEKKDKAREADSDEEKSDSDSDDDEVAYGTPAAKQLVNSLREHIASDGTDSLFEELRARQVSRGFDHQMRMYVLLEALFPDASLTAKTLAEHKGIVEKCIKNGRLSFSDWVWGFEAYLNDNAAALKVFAMVMKTLYDEDIAEEKDILKHYNSKKDSPGFEATKQSLTKFLEWLEEDDSSSDEDSDASSSDSDSD